LSIGCVWNPVSVLVTRTYATQNIEVVLKYKVLKIKEIFFYIKLLFPSSLQAVLGYQKNKILKSSLYVFLKI